MSFLLGGTPLGIEAVRRASPCKLDSHDNLHMALKRGNEGSFDPEPHSADSLQKGCLFYDLTYAPLAFTFEDDS